LVTAIVLLTVPALAGPGRPAPGPGPKGPPSGVPEIDPAGLVAAGTLFAALAAFTNHWGWL